MRRMELDTFLSELDRSDVVASHGALQSTGRARPKTAMRPAMTALRRRARNTRARARRAYEASLRAVADQMGLTPEEVRDTARGGLAVRQHRQLALYLAHVARGAPMHSLARVAGLHPHTVQNGVRRVEDRRENGDFDALVARLEEAV